MELSFQASVVTGKCRWKTIAPATLTSAPHKPAVRKKYLEWLVLADSGLTNYSLAKVRPGRFFVFIKYSLNMGPSILVITLT